MNSADVVQKFREVSLTEAGGGFGEYERTSDQDDDLFSERDDVFARDEIVQAVFDDDDDIPEEAQELFDDAHGNTHNEPEWLVAMLTRDGSWSLTGCESVDCYVTTDGEPVPVSLYENEPEQYRLRRATEDASAEILPEDSDTPLALVFRTEDHAAGRTLWQVEEAGTARLLYRRITPNTAEHAAKTKSDIEEIFPDARLNLRGGTPW